MELYLQFGHGMMGLSKDLIKSWNGGTVILSPRDLTKQQFDKFSNDVNLLNGKVVVDPQFYMPHANHDRLTSHSFWPNDYNTALFDPNEISRMLSVLKEEYNDPYDTPFFIVPSAYASEINEDWYEYNNLIIEEAQRLGISQPIYSTLCLSHEALRSEDQVHDCLEYLETWETDGCYVVVEPPNHNYLVEDPVWLVNLLDLCTGLKRLGKKVLLGYANHQLLCLSLAKIDAIASGTWLNVRSFNKGKFNVAPDSISRRSSWYYSPQALSEYQIAFLDIAKKLGVLNELKTDPSYGSIHSDQLFSGTEPSSVNYREPDAFKHYLKCLKSQVESSVKATYEDTKETLEIQLRTAEMLTTNLNQRGVTGRVRDFSNVVDINIAAINAYHQIRGVLQAHEWSTI